MVVLNAPRRELKKRPARKNSWAKRMDYDLTEVGVGRWHKSVNARKIRIGGNRLEQIHNL